MVERRREPRLARGALEVGAGPAGEHPDALERDGAAEDLVAAEPDDAHAAAPDLTLEGVSVCDDHLSAFPETPASGHRRRSGRRTPKADGVDPVNDGAQ